jgi:hypothetical protein
MPRDPYSDFRTCDACGQLAGCFAGKCQNCNEGGAAPAASAGQGGCTAADVADEIARIYGTADDETLARCEQRDAARARKGPSPGTEAFRDAVAAAIDHEMGGA